MNFKANWQFILTPYLSALFVVLFFAKMISPFLTILDVSSTLLLVFAIVSFIFSLFYLIQNKNLIKASLTTSILILFFSFKNMLIKAAKAFYLLFFRIDQYQIPVKYLLVIYLIAFLIFIALFIFLLSYFSKKLNKKFAVFLNTTFTILSLFELFNIVSYYNYYNTTYSPVITQYLNVEKDISKLQVSVKDSLPDVYWFLMDEYIGFDKGQKALNFENSELLTFLEAQNFVVAREAQSLYKETEKCIASIVNIKPLPALLDGDRKEGVHKYITSLYLKKMVNESYFGKIAQNHWDIKNLSFFDLANREKFYDFEDLSSSFTLKGHLMREQLNIRSLKKIAYFNKLVIENIPIKPINSHQNRPSFNYIHLLMPHAPYFFDENGKYYPNGNSVDRDSYVGYTKYTNKQIIKVIEDIRKNKPNAAIILMGDHGCRDSTFCKDCSYSPLFAIHLPQKDNLELPKNFNTTNTFKIILNEYFGQNLPYDTVKDSLSTN